jgi:ATP-dependent Clp protease protease subunit
MKLIIFFLLTSFIDLSSTFVNINMSHYSRRNFISNVGISMFTTIGSYQWKTKNVFADDEEIDKLDNIIVSSNTPPNFLVETDNNKIYFNGEITDESCILLRKSLLDASINSRMFGMTFKIKPIPIELHIQSYGGSFLPTLGIIDLINKLDVDVFSFIDSYAASAATMISVSCKKKFISKHSFMLIHQLSAGTQGKYESMTDEMKNLEQFMDTIKSIYLENTNIKKDEIDEILKKDIWFNAEKCLELGLVDEII